MANAFKNKGLDITAVEQVIYTAPASTESVIHAVVLTNITDGFESLVSLSVNDVSASADYKILHRVPVSPGSTLTFDKPINLEAGDSLKVSASDNNLMTAFLSVLEVS